MQVSEEFVAKIFAAIEADAKAEIKVDLPNQTVTIVESGESDTFTINGYKKNNMLNGFDDIDYLQSMKEEVKEFAAKQLF